jgi:hypothetical protein
LPTPTTTTLAATHGFTLDARDRDQLYAINLPNITGVTGLRDKVATLLPTGRVVSSGRATDAALDLMRARGCVPANGCNLTIASSAEEAREAARWSYLVHCQVDRGDDAAPTDYDCSRPPP